MRAFLAIDLPDHLVDKMVELQQELKDPCIKPIERQNIHLTVNFLGEVSEGEIKEIVDKLRAAKLEKTEISVKGIGVFPSQEYVRVIWIGAHGAEKLAKATDFTGEASNKAHFTIARVKCKTDVNKFLYRHKDLDLGTFTATELVLYGSVLEEAEPIYTKKEIIRLL